MLMRLRVVIKRRSPEVAARSIDNTGADRAAQLPAGRCQNEDVIHEANVEQLALLTRSPIKGMSAAGGRRDRRKTRDVRVRPI